MIEQHKRRPEFDAIADGWGSDGLDDLMARVELLIEYWRTHMPLTAAEHKVARAINARLTVLGGISTVSFH